MLYISQVEGSGDPAHGVDRLPVRGAEFLPGEHGQALAGMGAAPHRARPRPAGRLAHPARGRCQRRAQGRSSMALRDDVRRVLREARIGSPGAPVVRGNTVEVRIRESDLQQALAKLRELSQPLGGFLGSDRPALARCRECRRRADPAHRRPSRRCSSASGKSVEQSIQIIERRVNAARHGRAVDPAPGRRPHPGAGAGPAGSAAAARTCSARPPS